DGPAHVGRPSGVPVPAAAARLVRPAGGVARPESVDRPTHPGPGAHAVDRRPGPRDRVSELGRGAVARPVTRHEVPARPGPPAGDVAQARPAYRDGVGVLPGVVALYRARPPGLWPVDDRQVHRRG